MLAKDLEAALTGARLVEEAGSLLTLGEEPGRMVAHAFERLSQLVPYDCLLYTSPSPRDS